MIENSVLVQLRSSLENALERQQKALDRIAEIRVEQEEANRVFEERASYEQSIVDSLTRETDELKNAIKILEATLPKLPEPDGSEPPTTN
jgi:septal ring factor EnvC (AmiA/AmiB activator)